MIKPQVIPIRRKKPKERSAEALERIATATEAMQRELEGWRKYMQAIWEKRP